MRLLEILTRDRVDLVEGATTKVTALARLAELLARGVPEQTSIALQNVLREREALQSTGIGDGVAIPHGFLADQVGQVAALLIVRDGVEFEAIDGQPARIILGVIGPKKGQIEHLRILARISRILREPMLRERILAAKAAGDAFDIVAEADAKVP